MKNYSLIGFIMVLMLVSSCTTISPKQPVSSAQQGFDLHVDAKHHLKESRVLVHHWCKTINDNLTECLLFDEDHAKANLVGIETIVPNNVWATFTPEQQAEWHDHATEIVEAEATLPDTPPEEAGAIVAALTPTHGRVVYIWDFPNDQYPVVRPFLESDR